MQGGDRMYHRKYGKTTLSGWLNMELSQSSVALALFGGALLASLGIVCRAMTGSPYRVILELGVGELIPPVWLMTLLWTASFFLVGAATGFVLGYRMQGSREEKYKGGMYAILLCALELTWYPTLFGAALVFVSTLICLCILMASIAATVSFFRVSSFAGTILVFHDVWLAYMLMLNIAVLFHA